MIKIPRIIPFYNKDKYKKELIEAKIPRDQVIRIMPSLEKLVKADISENDLNTVVKEIATNLLSGENL